MNLRHTFRPLALAGACLAAMALADGKPAAYVDLSYTVSGGARAGHPVEVELKVTPKSEFDEIRLDFGVSERLTLDRSVPETMALIAQKPGVAAVQRLRVVPATDGLHYLKVRVVTLTDGRPRMRGIAIPISVGKYDERANLKVNGTLVDGVAGERAIVMSAQQD